MADAGAGMGCCAGCLAGNLVHRAIRRRPYDQNMSEQPLVRLMPEYSAPMPLWGRWQELELPELLLRRLAAWQEDFDSNFHWDHGWKSSAAREAWAADAATLETMLRQAVGDRARVTVDLWPLAH
jgi:hypothetical protein